MKVSDLSGAILDYWVLRAEGWVDDRLHDMQLTRNGEYCIAGAAPKHAINGHCWRSPSTDWAVGGPIIHRERITVAWQPMKGEWMAGLIETENGSMLEFRWLGFHELPLVAAMRAFVRFWFGDEVPDV